MLLLCLGCPSPGRADVGLPMVFVEWPLLLLALAPVILIESMVYRRQLGITYWKALYPAGIANLVSTLVGYPLAWILRLAGLFVLVYPLADVVKPSGTSMNPAWTQVLTALAYSAWLPPGRKRLCGCCRRPPWWAWFQRTSFRSTLRPGYSDGS